MRATYRCGRNGNAKHNDRTFDLDAAPHIDQEKTRTNLTWHCYSKNPKFQSATFEEVERTYYTNRYSNALNATNQRYKDQRHPERCKSIESLLKGRQTRPTETILQIGNMDEHPDEKIFLSCMSDMMKYINQFNREHGHHYRALDYAVHFDEKTPHVQIRGCFEYIDQDGNPRLGQDKSLQEMGIDLPDPSKAKGRYNNRKMTFDNIMRTKWIEILKEHGLQIETDPLPSRRHLDKEDYIDLQIRKKSEEIYKLEKSVESLKISEESLKKSIDKLKADQIAYEQKKEKWDKRFGSVEHLAPTLPTNSDHIR